MKKNIGVKKVIGIVLIAFLILTTKVYAANDSFETTLKANNTKFKAGESVTITIGLNNIAIESGDKGIGAYTGNIKFDSSVLEYVSAAGTDKWEKPTYQDGAITAATSDGNVVKTAQSIGTITFKVKEGAKLGETTISLENFNGSTAEKDVLASNKSVKVTIVGKDSSNGNNGSGNNNSSKPNNKPSTSGDNKLNVVDVDKQQANIKDGVLPQTGESNIVVFIAIGGCILLAVTLFIRMKLLNNKIK